MKKITLLLVVFILGIGGKMGYGTEKKFSTSFFKAENNQKDINDLEPDFLYKPLIYLVITNPSTNKSIVASAYIDTGANHCYINKKLADDLGLVRLNQPPQTVYTASGSIEAYAVEAQYQLANEEKELFHEFPTQKTHFYINEHISQPIILGFMYIPPALGHRFRQHSATDSANTRPLIPLTLGHLFR